MKSELMTGKFSIFSTVGASVMAFALFLFYSSTFIVDERQQAIVMRFSEIKRVLTEPGLYFKIPTNIVDTVQLIDDRLIRFDLDDIRVQVRDGRWYLVDAFVVFHIDDAAKFRGAVGGSMMRAQSNIKTQLDAALRRVYGRRSFEDAMSERRAEMMKEVYDSLRKDVDRLGIEVVDVRIRGTELTLDVSQQTFERMRAERLAEAAELRARGTEESMRIRAEADRKAVILIASAHRESEILRGEGEAKRSDIFAKAYKKDPEFFHFYRSLKAYKTAMTDKKNSTTMILSPGSGFFRYFQDEKGLSADQD